MHVAFAIDELVHWHDSTLGDRVARAFLVEEEYLRYQPVEPPDRMHTRFLYMVLGMPVPIEMGRVLQDPLCCCLEVHEKLFRKHPLDTKGIPSVIKGDHTAAARPPRQLC